ncbi:MAG: class I SAM-dependent methyltransferase [Planctomycetes bacterium]|nr:class I SAM-dependent methyltransferase [Planctomycetota bacterium]
MSYRLGGVRRSAAEWTQRWRDFFQRRKYALLRRLIPRIREQDRRDRLAGPLGYWQRLQSYQLGFLKSMGLAPHHSLLDIGCGPLQGGLAFIEYLEPNNYVGIDRRPEPLAEGYRLLATHDLVHKNPRLIVSDTFGRRELNGSQFDFAWSCQMLYHLDPETIHACFEHVTGHLKSGACLYGDIIGYPNKVTDRASWNGYKFHLHTLEFLKNAAREHGLVMEHLGQIRDFGYPEEIALHTNEMLQFQKAR